MEHSKPFKSHQTHKIEWALNLLKLAEIEKAKLSKSSSSRQMTQSVPSVLMTARSSCIMQLTISSQLKGSKVITVLLHILISLSMDLQLCLIARVTRFCSIAQVMENRSLVVHLCTKMRHGHHGAVLWVGQCKESGLHAQTALTSTAVKDPQTVL